MAINSERLKWDSITDLTITNLVFNSRKESVIAPLRRCEALEIDGEMHVAVIDQQPADPSVPPPRSFELVLSVGDELGHGRSGTVFSTTLESLWESNDEDSPTIDFPDIDYLPPLVVKVAKEGCRSQLAKEALNYRLLKSLQGVAIPRYYGWFNVTLEEGFYYVGENPRNAPTGSRTISVLLMEQMGEHLDLKETQEEIDDIKDMLRDVARKRLEHDDFRYENLLRAPSSPPGLPGEFCRAHDCEHKFRLIDLEGAKAMSDRSIVSLAGSLIIQLGYIYRPRKIL